MPQLILLFADFISITASFLLALLLRFKCINPQIANLWSTFVFLLFTTPVIFYFYNLYNHYLYAQLGRLFYKLINTLIFSLILYVVTGFATKFYFLIDSRIFIIIFYLILLLLTSLIRFVLIPTILKFYFLTTKRQTVCNYTGPEEFYDTVKEFLEENPVLGLKIVPEKNCNPKENSDATFLYSIESDFGELYKEIKSKIIPGRQIHIISDLFNDLNIDWEWAKISSHPVYTIRLIKNSNFIAILQRIIDIIVSLFFLIVLSPLFLIVAIAVKLDSPGPIIYKQKRCGRDGKEFTLYKFRSMYFNNEENQKKREIEYYDYIHNRTTKGKIIDTTEITPVGRILRRTSIDEFPQFLNVLKGEMTLVGPRPALPYEVKYYKDWHKERLKAKPGITGLWQVYGRGNMPCDSSIFLDLIYILNRSFTLDIKLIFKTIPAVLLGKGAY